MVISDFLCGCCVADCEGVRTIVGVVDGGNVDSWDVVDALERRDGIDT